MWSPEEFFYIFTVGNIGFKLYQHADIFEICELENIVKIPVYKLFHADLKNLKSV